MVETLDRSDLVAVQTPQAFRAEVLRRAHDGEPDATDDAALVEAIGAAVVTVAGEAQQPEDHRRSADPGPPMLPGPAAGSGRPGVARSERRPVTEQRVGLGVDVHPFAEPTPDGPAEPAAIASWSSGASRFPGERALRGHSDADVVAHASPTPILGAAGLGDLGVHFPDTDERWRGADSLVLLRTVVERAAAEGWRVVNADCTVVGERPKIVARREEMVARLSEAAGAPVHVKATRPEGLGSLGRVEGIACLAVVLLERSADAPGR